MAGGRSTVRSAAASLRSQRIVLSFSRRQSRYNKGRTMNRRIVHDHGGVPETATVI